MKVKTLLYHFIFVVMMSLSSCDNNAIFDESVVIPNASWDNKKSPYFDVTIDDTLSNHIFSLNIRHLEITATVTFMFFCIPLSPTAIKHMTQ